MGEVERHRLGHELRQGLLVPALRGHVHQLERPCREVVLRHSGILT
jgi:hypothetical protein